MSSSLTGHFMVFWMGEQKLNKSRGKANKNRGNWIWRNEMKSANLNPYFAIKHDGLELNGSF